MAITILGRQACIGGRIGAMDRFEIKKKFQLILNFKRLGQYKTLIERDNPDYIVEELVNFDQVNNRLYIDYALSSPRELKILEREQMYMGVGGAIEVYNGPVPNLVENFVFGDVENPGFYKDHLLERILEELDYEKISKDLKTSYKLGAGSYIISYYSPEYDLVAINIYQGKSQDVVYFDLRDQAFVDFNERPIWIKAYMEKI